MSRFRGRKSAAQLIVSSVFLSANPSFHLSFHHFQVHYHLLIEEIPTTMFYLNSLCENKGGSLNMNFNERTSRQSFPFPLVVHVCGIFRQQTIFTGTIFNLGTSQQGLQICCQALGKDFLLCSRAILFYCHADVFHFE